MTLHILALETSSSLCGVALLSFGDAEPALRVLEHDATAEHAERLLPMVDALLSQAGITRSQLSAVAFGQGPGGFTGLRVACGVAQGIGFALGIPVLPISSLLAAAAADFALQQAQGGQGIGSEGEVRVVVQDARMQEVYMAAYVAFADQEETAWLQIQEPVLLSAGDVGIWLDQAYARRPGRYRVLGDALQAYPGLNELVVGREAVELGLPVRADAGTVARLARQNWLAGRLTPPEHAAPVYVRDKVAFTTAEREQGAGGNPRAQGLAPAAGSGASAELAIVPMTEAHLDQVADIERLVQSHPWSRNNFADGLKAGYRALVAQRDGHTQGFFMLMLAPDIAHLLVIAVRPGEQGKGIGSRLLSCCEHEARSRGLPAIMLEVRPSNGKALHFYQSRGYRLLATRKDYYPAGDGRREDAYVMKKELAPPEVARNVAGMGERAVS
ncbi:tRNA (adenosine(37)-N6)-threonylcarbamoyltransferase complex dimerization subunit type 1 TsaB [Allopusillimonas ginsengisoli]|uniref:tRNA (adenosine(37)-N6)-threonylcarbamoyltransferase complex dimerization subunit type 1 TsaB n=1 Tax=Allopusillimonas ginsengisoli TaxID=453575 RepID=UPI001021E301|nr:tRNA (adenosine(37)-N6)-threonylcarbamoyltransferase complex dimerization subunit type 1 TsaB [Allopusillimonas ginsengisoli]TEA78559.1 tRNA (adenosine(37)-N6)-threonylcarbamoyltransferase complex dimerization subunit type 1 TsaB [Allopusillimonas ginsengisoli]